MNDRAVPWVVERLKLLKIGINSLYADESLSWQYNTSRHQQCNFFSQRTQEEIKGHARCSRQALWDNSFSTRFVRSLQENEYNLKDRDKVFASLWVSHSTVLIGTKCNKLQLLKTETGQIFDLPLIAVEDTMPFRHKPGSNWFYPSPADSFEDISRLPFTPHDVPFTATNHNIRPNDIADRFRPSGGIHAIVVNPSRTFIATGAANSNYIGIYTFPAFEPVALLAAHSDWIFSLTWTSDTTLMSASRDRTLSYWSLSEVFDEWMQLKQDMGTSEPFVTVFVPSPKMTVSSGYGKPRHLVFREQGQVFWELSTDAVLKEWDLERLVCTKTVLVQHHETVTAAIDQSHRSPLIACGSVSHIVLVDPRQSNIVHSAFSLDDGWGVRSISFHPHASFLTVGGGMGRISFYDLRAQKYIPVPTNKQLDEDELYYKAGKGWLKRDLVFQMHFQRSFVHNAVHSHCYDPSGVKLFVAGGPLQLGLCGSYAALWQ